MKTTGLLSYSLCVLVGTAVLGCSNGSNCGNGSWSNFGALGTSGSSLYGNVVDYATTISANESSTTIKLVAKPALTGSEEYIITATTDSGNTTPPKGLKDGIAGFTEFTPSPCVLNAQNNTCDLNLLKGNRNGVYKTTLIYNGKLLPNALTTEIFGLSLSISSESVFIGESSIATVSLNGSSLITTPVTVSVSSNVSSVATVVPPTCQVTTANPTCTVNILANESNAGTSIISASAAGYTSVTTNYQVTAIMFTALSVPLFVESSSLCAIANNGKAYCWGSGTSGQIGNGLRQTVNVPTAVVMPAGVRFTQIQTTELNSCALGDNGVVYCWGAGTYGQIGNGRNSDCTIPTPVSMPYGVQFTSISTGVLFLGVLGTPASHFCGLTTDGSVYCWGYGVNGQIGNNAFNDVNVPTAVIMPNSILFTQLYTNGYGSCALSASGRSYCWGAGIVGQIGNNTWNNESIPTATVLPSGVNGFTKLSNSGSGSCALIDSGNAYCWGSGLNGEIGNGATFSESIPTAVIMPNSVSFTQLTTSLSGSCALTARGAAYCWGSGTNGEIGNSGNLSVSVPTAVTMPSGVSFTQVFTGMNNSCALTAAGVVYCWGFGLDGQIGNGANSNVTLPTSVTMPNNVSFTQMSLANYTSCALGSNGKAYCWGNGQYGSIGNGSNNNTNVPTQVVMPLK